MAKTSIYDFIKDWFNFSFENPDLVSPTHTAMYLWFVELNNRMGWAEKYGAPASQTMDAIGLKSYNTYKKIFDQLIAWGFIELIKPSKNQYQSCVIALSKNEKAPNKALDKALTNQPESPIKIYKSTIQSTDESTIQSTIQSTGESTDSIIRQTTNKPIDKLQAIENASSKFEKAKIPVISPNRGSHCPTWQAVYECFYRLGHPDKAFEFFEYWEGLGWMKGITPISNFASFANRWVANPISQAENKTESVGSVVMEHIMSGNEVTWSKAEYEQYCKNSGFGYKFLRNAV